MQYSPDGKRMVLSAVNRGKTDLYLYQVIGNNFEQLTRDFWDDRDPSFIEGGQRIIFTSNRVDDTLRAGADEWMHLRPEHDVYVFDLENRSKLLERITNTSQVHESLPFEYSDKYYSFLADDNGYRNRSIAYVDSVISAIDTSIHYRYFTVTKKVSELQRDVHDFEFRSKDGSFFEGYRRAGQPWIVIGNRNNDVLSGLQTGSESAPEDIAFCRYPFKGRCRY